MQPFREIVPGYRRIILRHRGNFFYAADQKTVFRRVISREGLKPGQRFEMPERRRSRQFDFNRIEPVFNLDDQIDLQPVMRAPEKNIRTSPLQRKDLHRLTCNQALKKRTSHRSGKCGIPVRLTGQGTDQSRIKIIQFRCFNQTLAVIPEIRRQKKAKKRGIENAGPGFYGRKR